MLTQMRLRNLGVIDDATLEFSPGLNVLTGETGAGKTMIVSGLSLLLGARADAGLVRPGADSAGVEGCLDVADGHLARARVDDAGGDATDEIVLARTVSAQGRSRAHVGGRSAPVAVLSELGELLVAVHGQADQWRLRRPEAHRDMLDAFGGPDLEAARARYRALFDEHAELLAELERTRRLERDRALEVDVLRSGLEELERVDPLPGEDDDLRAEDERLANADGLRLAAARAHALLAGGDDLDGGGPAGVSEALASASAALTGVLDHDDALRDLSRRIDELSYLATDLGGDLATYLASVEADPVRLAHVQERRAELARLHRKYGADNAEVLAWGARAAARLADLDGAQERAGRIGAELAGLRERLGVAAGELSSRRAAAADELGRRVTAELAHLSMGRALVQVAVETRPASPCAAVEAFGSGAGKGAGKGADKGEGRAPGAADDADGAATGGLTVPGLDAPVRFGPHGVDDVEIRLAANAGAPPRSVAKAASGGELSRVMLALEVVTGGTPRAAGGAEAGPELPTFVFDEVDAGVGGRAALDIGARLAVLARHAQVIVVTHLPQVAAFADRHLVVHKTHEGHVTSSGVRCVEGDDRVAELARMMAGDDSPVALDHAAQLLEQAHRRAREAPEAGDGGASEGTPAVRPGSNEPGAATESTVAGPARSATRTAARGKPRGTARGTGRGRAASSGRGAAVAPAAMT